MLKFLFILLVFVSSVFAADFNFRCSQDGWIAQYLTNKYEFVNSTKDIYSVIDFDKAKSRKHGKHGGIVVEAWLVSLYSRTNKNKFGFSFDLLAYDIGGKAYKILASAKYSCNGDLIDSWDDSGSSDYIGWSAIVPGSLAESDYNKIKEALAR